jgi:hypothetical protein
VITDDHERRDAAYGFNTREKSQLVQDGYRYLRERLPCTPSLKVIATEPRINLRRDDQFAR